MKKKAYAVLVDIRHQTVGVNIKDSTLPESARKFEGLIHLFGGTVEDGETAEMGLPRELEEEIPGFVSDEDRKHARLVVERPEWNVFAIPTDLSGHRSTRSDDRVGQLARVCKEGEGAVRTIAFVRRAPDVFFVAPETRLAILACFDALATAST